MEILIATTADVEDTYQLYDEARSHLRAKGILQWPEGYPSEQTVRNDIDRRELYVLWSNGCIAGAVCLNQQQDAEYQKIDWSFDGRKVMVVHRLVVDPSLQGQGLGQTLMDFAERLAEEERYTSIRLDAYTGHERTRWFYERRGYKMRGEVMFPQREMPFWCFERKVYNTSAMKIIAVCLGNICRSPLAEGLLRREAESRGLNWEVASGGTAGYHTGNPPDPRSVAVAHEHGLDISTQRSHHVTAADLEYYDVVFGMDRQNVADLRARAETEQQREKVHLFLEFAGLEETDGPDVFDPYYDDNAYAGVYELVARAAEATVIRLMD